MPLCTRDGEVKERASRTATPRRSTVTDAVREAALALRLKQLEDDREERRRNIDVILAKFDAILAKCDAEPDLAPGFTDKDLHDGNGDPIL